MCGSVCGGRGRPLGAALLAGFDCQFFCYGRAAVDWRQCHACGPEGWREAAEIFREMVQPQATVFMNYAAAVLPLRHGGWRESEHKGICKRK
jgi:hypothetical protein